MKTFIIPLPVDVCVYLEKLIFETNSYKNILNYLCARNNPNLLDKYFKEAHKKDIELNLYKQEIEKEFLPTELQDKEYKYKINYQDFKIIYEVF